MGLSHNHGGCSPFVVPLLFLSFFLSVITRSSIFRALIILGFCKETTSDVFSSRKTLSRISLTEDADYFLLFSKMDPCHELIERIRLEHRNVSETELASSDSRRKRFRFARPVLGRETPVANSTTLKKRRLTGRGTKREMERTLTKDEDRSLHCSIGAVIPILPFFLLITMFLHRRIFIRSSDKYS